MQKITLVTSVVGIADCLAVLVFTLLFLKAAAGSTIISGKFICGPLALFAGFIAPVFMPLKLGDWKVVTSLISGFIAKESVVSSLTVMYAGGITTAFSTGSAAALLVFSLLYTPCVASIAAVRRALGAKWAAALVIWQCTVAWIVAFIVSLIIP